MHTGLDCFLGANDEKNSSNDLFGDGLILDKSELIAQLLSAEPKENNTKYIRQGPREFVSYEYSEKYQTCLQSSLPGKFNNLCILASEQGPSCSRWMKFQASKSLMFAL